MDNFVSKFAELFEDTAPSEITALTKFRELEEWSSLIGMGVLAMAKLEYDKIISSNELKNCNIVSDIFNLIANK